MEHFLFRKLTSITMILLLLFSVAITASATVDSQGNITTTDVTEPDNSDIEVTVPDVTNPEETTNPEDTTAPEETTPVFIKAPAVKSLKNAYSAVKIQWKEVEGAAQYAVFKKTSKTEFTQIAQIEDNCYYDSNVKYRGEYTYAVKCLDENGVIISELGAEKSIKFIKSPEFKKFQNKNKCTEITWNKISEAYKYRVYVLTSAGSWKSIGTTKSTTLTDYNLKNKKTYTYTIRCLDKNGKNLSGVNLEGTDNLYLSPMSISSISRSNSVNTIKWKAVPNAESYTVYRTSLGGSRKKLATVKSASYKDKTAKSNVAYQYTVLARNDEGTAITYYNESEKYYSNGKLANGIFKYSNIKQNVKKGVPAEKLKIKSDSMYFYNSKGKLLKKGVVGSSALGYYYADSKGKIDLNYCGVAKKDGKSWNVICGKATKVVTEKDKTLCRALKVINKITTADMTKSEKLRICYDYVAKTYDEYNPRIPHFHGKDWEIIYANDIFVGGGGNCFSFGSAFAFIAKGIGYENVYACNSGGHGWAEVNGKVYDPERSRWDKKSDFYGLEYTDGPVSHYKKSISGESWKRVKI